MFQKWHNQYLIEIIFIFFTFIAYNKYIYLLISNVNITNILPIDRRMYSWLVNNFKNDIYNINNISLITFYYLFWNRYIFLLFIRWYLCLLNFMLLFIFASLYCFTYLILFIYFIYICFYFNYLLLFIFSSLYCFTYLLLSQNCFQI